MALVYTVCCNSSYFFLHCSLLISQARRVDFEGGSNANVCHFDFIIWTKMLFHVLHLVFTSYHGIATLSHCPMLSY